MSGPELMEAETGRTTPEFLGGATKSKVGNNAEIDCCYSRWLRSRLVSTGTNTRASTAARRARFPYEPRFVAGKLIMPAELQRIHSIVLDAVEVETISDEMRAVVESLWPELAYKLPPRR